MQFSKKENLAFTDELSLYLIHGYLHLCGFDDIEDSDRVLMRRAEQQALEIVRAAKTMPTFSLK